MNGLQTIGLGAVPRQALNPRGLLCEGVRLLPPLEHPPPSSGPDARRGPDDRTLMSSAARAPRSPWRALLARAAPHRARLALATLGALVAAAGASLWAWLLGPLLGALLTSAPANLGWVRLSREELLTALPGLLIAVALLRGFANFVHTGLMESTAQRVLRALRRELYARLLAVPPGWFDTQHSGELLTRFTSDVDKVEFAVGFALSRLVRDSLQLLALLVTCFLIDPRLAVLAFVVIPLTLLPLRRFARSLKRTAREAQGSLGALTTLVAESLANLSIVQAYRAEALTLERFDLEQTRYLQVMRRSLLLRGAYSPTLEFLGVLGVAACLAVGAQAVAADPALSTRLVSFLAAALLLYQPVKGLSQTASQLSAAAGSAERVFELLEVEPEDGAGRPCGPLREALRFEGAVVEYGDGRQGLRGLTLEVPAGKRTALVGASGSGKTTALAVILRFVELRGGAATWDGAPLASLSREALRAQVAWVPQEPVLLSGTVGENLRLGAAQADEPALWKALQQAHAEDFVRALPQGLATEVGERGARLSGGQRQRLALARAFLRSPSLLLLDEPTAALDAASEEAVQLGLAALMAGRTVLVVAHRLSTVRTADLIHVLGEGRVLESGTHAALLARGGAYARLVASARGEQLAE